MNCSRELWKWVSGYEGLYMVSNKGNVFGTPKVTHYGHLMKKTISKSGYECVCLCKENKPRTFRVHRLVADAFCEKRPGACEVNHKDGNRSNNDASNLEWVTRSENELHAYKVLGKKPNRPWAGKPRKFARTLSNEQVHVIRDSTLPSRNLAKKYGVSKTTIQNIRNRKIYKEVV